MKKIAIPVYNMCASAGMGCYLDNTYTETVLIDEDDYVEGTDFGIRISGDSMEPVYHDGQIVCVRQTAKLDDGEVGIFIYRGESYIKQLSLHREGPTYHIALLSLNPEYGPKIIGDVENFRIVGRVVS